MNLPFLKILYQNYLQFSKSKPDVRLIVFDSERISIKESANLISNHIISALAKPIPWLERLIRL